LVFYGPRDNTHHIGIYVGPYYYLLQNDSGGGENIVNEYGTLSFVQVDAVDSPYLTAKKGANPPKYCTYSGAS
jgi:hypothetical protein